MPTLDLADVPPGYRALVGAVGVVDLTGRSQIELTGTDRNAFLHNFCTNSIRNLPPGAGTEAFILDAKGHVLAHVFVFAGPSSIILDTVPDQSARIATHLGRYIIRENVEVRDRTDDWSVLLVAGPQAAALMESLAIKAPEKRLSHAQSSLGGISVYARRVDFVGPDTWQLVCPRSSREAISQALANAGAIPADAEAFDMARIESGTPLYARDISEANLPQEVNRDTLAISFTKGCYLGQETVARIDALGHVNRVLVGVRFDTREVPGTGTELQIVETPSDAAPAASSAAGTVTSAAYSPRLQSALALAYVRRGHTQPGAKMTSAVGSAEVIALPL